jgi:hypothetical protein
MARLDLGGARFEFGRDTKGLRGFPESLNVNSRLVPLL